MTAPPNPEASFPRVRGRPPIISDGITKRIVTLITGGHYIETAAAFAGVGRSTVFLWLKRGRAEMNRLDSTPKAKLREREAPYVDFVDAVEKALGMAEVRDLNVIDRAAQGGVELGSTTTVTRRVPVPQADGALGYADEVTTTEVRSKAAPTWQAAAWRLERRNPESFGRRTVEVTGPNGGPIEQIVEFIIQNADGSAGALPPEGEPPTP